MTTSPTQNHPPSEELRRQIADFTLSATKPLYWHDRKLGWPKKVQSASSFVLRFDDRYIGVTADHVVEIFLVEQEKNPRLVCQMGLTVVDLKAQLIDRDGDLDIATFELSPEQVQSMSAVAIDCTDAWPPPGPQTTQPISFAGFPESIRVVRMDGSGEFRAYGGLGEIEDVTADKILTTYDPLRDRRMLNAPEQPPVGFNMSGCSGAPVFSYSMTRGLFRWHPIGIIVAGSGEEPQGEAAEFDMIWIRRIDCIQSDGTIRRRTEEMLTE